MATTTETTTAAPSEPLFTYDELHAPAGSIRPAALCHFVLRTTPENYKEMVKWYIRFTGGWASHAARGITFIAYDDEHHRIGIVPRANAVPRPKDRNIPIVGLGHAAFGFKTLAELADSYEQKKKNGILPVWTVNHGPTTSMYYRDPDGNEVETQVDNFDTVKEVNDFMDGPEFEENPFGVDYDPEEFVRRVRSGEDDRSIKKRPRIGPRHSK